MAGKGSKPRPLSVDRKTFESNWDRIFRKDPSNQDIDASVLKKGTDLVEQMKDHHAVNNIPEED